MEIFSQDLILPITGAIMSGAVIGMEREYRASPAGLRTHILVSLSCCLLMLAAVHQMAWLNDTPAAVIRIDPVRMAHGLLTGIGFLCGGVIFREGLNVRGLTTAASLWTTATLGILFGIGFYQLAIFATITTFLVLAAVTITEKHAPQRRIAHLSISYEMRPSLTISQFAAMLSDYGFAFLTINQEMDGTVHIYSAIASGYTEKKAELLAAALAADPHILAYKIQPQQG